MSGQRSLARLAFSGQLKGSGYPVVRETKIDGHTDVRITVALAVVVVVIQAQTKRTKKQQQQHARKRC